MKIDFVMDVWKGMNAQDAWPQNVTGRAPSNRFEGVARYRFSVEIPDPEAVQLPDVKAQEENHGR